MYGLIGVSTINEEEEIKEEMLYETYVAAYKTYISLEADTEVGEIVTDTVSFKLLLGGFIYLYEKYKDINEEEVLH